MKALIAVALLMELAPLHACTDSDDPDVATLQQAESVDPADGGASPIYMMDPEPDRKKDRKSCWNWCEWNRRQCEKECWHEFPEPFGDWYKRSVCIQKRCEDDKNPDVGIKACKADCNRRFPERPIPATEPSP